jgi:hypothetical protein
MKIINHKNTKANMVPNGTTTEYFSSQINAFNTQKKKNVENNSRKHESSL